MQPGEWSRQLCQFLAREQGQFSANVGLGAADPPSDRYISWHGSPINGINDMDSTQPIMCASYLGYAQ